jgi:hypothetical protein
LEIADQVNQISNVHNEPGQSTVLPDELSKTEVAGRSADRHHVISNDETTHTDFDKPSMTYFDNQDVDRTIENASGIDNSGRPSMGLPSFTTSPASTTSGNPYSAEVAPLRWLNLVRHDAVTLGDYQSASCFSDLEHGDCADRQPPMSQVDFASVGISRAHVGQVEPYNVDGQLELSGSETSLLRHFVENISTWIDLTDRDALFATSVPTMALKNKGLMLAILALSSRHQSLPTGPKNPTRLDRTTAVQYYNETLHYLQIAMKMPEYLKSDELLTTVFLISTYEMMDGFESGWERHLKGVQIHPLPMPDL